MVRCAILDDYQNAALRYADWSALKGKVDVRVYREHFETVDALVDAVKDCEILVTIRERTRITREVFARLPNLKLLSTMGSKNAAIDLEAAEARGIPVCGTRSNSMAMPELVWGLILGFLRKIPQESHNMRVGGPWQVTVGMDLYGKTMGLLGLGKSAKLAAGVAKAFGMNVQSWSQNLTKEKCDDAGVQYAGSLNNLVSTSDIISVHLVLSDRTRHLLGEEQFRLMKPNALVVNPSRGPIIDEAAMIRALQEKRIAGAALDTFEQEPLPRDHPLRTLDNVLATPHMGYVTEVGYTRYFTDTVENIAAWIEGAELPRLIKKRWPA